MQHIGGQKEYEEHLFYRIISRIGQRGTLLTIRPRLAIGNAAVLLKCKIGQLQTLRTVNVRPPSALLLMV